MEKRKLKRKEQKENKKATPESSKDNNLDQHLRKSEKGEVASTTEFNTARIPAKLEVTKIVAEPGKVSV